MKLITKNDGKSILKISKAEWIALADKNDWMDGPLGNRPQIQPNQGPIETSPSGATLPTFNEILKRHRDTEHRHHLRLVCVRCGNIETCRCDAPKTEEKGICSDCNAKAQFSGKQR